MLEFEKTLSTIIGESKAIRQVCQTIGKFAKTDHTVLIQGPTGVGKELVSKALHAHSNVSHGPFIKVNCAVLPDNLIESELFGHIKGAFTDAHISRKGRFEEAQSGTILLDEIGTMPFFGQAKLLRVLEEKEFQPVGSSTTIKCNARIIATTNVHLEKAVAKGNFRADLYHRLNMVPIYIPPLQKRREDIPLIVYHFLEQFCAEIKKDICGFSREVFEHIMNSDWPGNVRQLKNFVGYCVIAEDTRIIQPESCPYDIREKTAGELLEYNPELFDGLSLKTSLRDIEGQIIRYVLSLAKGKKSQAALILKIDKRNLSYFLKKHSLGLPEKSQKIPFASFAEKRSSNRLSLSFPFSLHLRRGANSPYEKLIIFTKDISSRGLRFNLPFSPPDRQIRVSFMMPGFLEKIKGRICWLRKKDFSGYTIGAEIAKNNKLAKFLKERLSSSSTWRR
jgi:DNA-binding NtrC family response regulator